MGMGKGWVDGFGGMLEGEGFSWFVIWWLFGLVFGD